MTKVYLNDKIVNADEAKVLTADSGFLYGMGLFETMRADNDKVFAIDDHIDRLLKSAEELAIAHNYDRAMLTSAINQTVIANELTDARIRLTLTSGPMGVDQPQPTLLVTATEFAPYPPEFYEKGVTVILSDIRQNITDPTCGHKTTNFFARLVDLGNAHKRQAAESIWFTIDNRLAEGCVSNVFLVKDSKLYTPKTDTPVLPGIARKHVLKIAGDNDIKAVEKDLTIDDLLSADEVFITNTIMTVLPVIQIESHTVAQGKPGEITKQLLTQYNEMIAS